MPEDTPAAPRCEAANAVPTGIDVSGCENLPGLDALPRSADGTIAAGVLCVYADALDEAMLDSDDEALELVVLLDRLTAWTQGRQTSALAEFARRPRSSSQDPVVARAQRARVGRDVRDLGGGEEVAAALALSVRAGQDRLGMATTLAGGFPATLAALTRGAIDLGRAMTLVGEAAGCAADARAQIEAAVLAGGRRSTPSHFRQVARRAVLRIDAENARVQAQRARDQVYVATHPTNDDTAFLEGYLPGEDGLAIRLVLDAAATAMSGGAETRTRDQLRVAALAAPFWAALASGQLDSVGGPIALAVAHGQVPAIDMDVDGPIDAAGPADSAVAAVALRGYGPITLDTARVVAARARAGRWPVVRIHDHNAASTAFADAAAEPRYRPSARLERHVIDRDKHCRFPGCTARPALCDVDHTVAWPAGPTHASNLGLLCRHHHRVKQEAGFRVTQPEPGVFRWRMPTGHEYDVGPPD